MSKRQRDVLRALRSRERTDAVALHQEAQARDAVARAHLQALSAEHARANAPPSKGTVTRVDREVRRRHHLARLHTELQAARAAVRSTSAALTTAAEALQQRVRDVQAVDVLDARAAEAARRDQTRRAENAAEDRNRSTAHSSMGAGLDDDALQ